MRFSRLIPFAIAGLASACASATTVTVGVQGDDTVAFQDGNGKWQVLGTAGLAGGQFVTFQADVTDPAGRFSFAISHYGASGITLIQSTTAEETFVGRRPIDFSSYLTVPVNISGVPANAGLYTYGGVQLGSTRTGTFDGAFDQIVKGVSPFDFVAVGRQMHDGQNHTLEGRILIKRGLSTSDSIDLSIGGPNEVRTVNSPVKVPAGYSVAMACLVTANRTVAQLFQLQGVTPFTVKRPRNEFLDPNDAFLVGAMKSHAEGTALYSSESQVLVPAIGGLVTPTMPADLQIPSIDKVNTAKGIYTVHFTPHPHTSVYTMVFSAARDKERLEVIVSGGYMGEGAGSYTLPGTVGAITGYGRYNALKTGLDMTAYLANYGPTDTLLFRDGTCPVDVSRGRIALGSNVYWAKARGSVPIP